jgi:hypothetical protein
VDDFSMSFNLRAGVQMKPSIAWLAPLLALVASGCEFPYPGDYVPDANPTTCGNNRLDDGEDCDGVLLSQTNCFTAGHVSGALACTTTCTFDFSGCFDCGDGAVSGPEVCDGLALAGNTCEGRGHDGGMLACAPSCLAFDESACTDCGNGMRQGEEACDGADRGGETCMSLGFAGGTLACNASCMFDTSACNNTLPTVPRLRLPMNEAYVGSVHVADSLRPRFAWEPSTWGGAGTVGYELQFSTDATFAMGVTTVPTATTNHRPAVDLPVRMVAPVGTRYFWRVRACVNALCSAYSATWKVNLGRSDRDLNGDGFADIVVGAPLNDAGGGDAGRVYVYLGGPGGTLDPTADGVLTGVAGETFGSSVSIAPDLNGDGFADLVVGSPNNGAGGVMAGRAYVYFGGSGSTLDATADGTLTGMATQDEFGKSVASAGDVNGDGFADVVVGANQTSSASGRAFLFFGGPGVAFDQSVDATLRGQVNGDFFGYSVSSAGDTNGDGFADVLVGAFLHGSGAGSAYVFLGGSGAFDATADGTVSGVAANDWLGISVASAGDVNGDGFADIVVGAEGNDAGGIGAGQAYVYYGSASDTLDPTPDGTLTGAAAGDTFGRSVASAGDVNGDGFSDVVVGAFLANGVVADVGRAYVYLGAATATFDATADGVLSPAAVLDDKFGQSVASAGDANGDGFADVVVGAPGNDTTAMNAGRIYAYFGAAGAAFNTTVDGSPSGVSANDFFGQAVH